MHRRVGKKSAISFPLWPALVVALVALVLVWRVVNDLFVVIVFGVFIAAALLAVGFIQDHRRRKRHTREHTADQVDPDCQWCRYDYEALLRRQARDQQAAQRAQYDAWREQQTQQAIAHHQQLRQQYGEPR